MNVQNTGPDPIPGPTPAGGGRDRTLGVLAGTEHQAPKTTGRAATDGATAAAAEGGPTGPGFAGQATANGETEGGAGARPGIGGAAIGSGAEREAAMRPTEAERRSSASLSAGVVPGAIAGLRHAGSAERPQPQTSGSPVGSGTGARWSSSMGTAAPGRSLAPGRSVASYLAQFAEPDGYLDFARFGTVSADVALVLERAATTVRVQGWDALAEYDLAVERAKGAVGELLGCGVDEVGFVSSTSHGLAAATFGLRGPGTVVVARSDFPAAVYPWLRAAERGGLGVRFADGPLTADRLRPLLDDSVRAVSVCAVDAASGFVAPVGELKELIGARRVLVVDAVQALGATPFEVEAADVVAAGGQKFLRAGWGAAVLAVRERVGEFLGPGIGGWAGVEDPIGEAPHPHPPRAGGTAHMFTNPDGPAVAAFGAGLRLALDTGVEQIHKLIGEVVGAIADAARGAGAEVEAHGSGIMRLRMPDVDPGVVHAALTDAGLTTTLRGAWIRVSPHASSRLELADRIGDALRSVGGRDK